MSKEVMQQALLALERTAISVGPHPGGLVVQTRAAITALREALEAQQEPVAWEYGYEIFWHDSPDINDHIRATGNPLVYADRRSVPRQPLTDEQADKLVNDVEELVGMTADAWDCITPREIVRAVLAIGAKP